MDRKEADSIVHATSKWFRISVEFVLLFIVNVQIITATQPRP